MKIKKMNNKLGIVKFLVGVSIFIITLFSLVDNNFNSLSLEPPTKSKFAVITLTPISFV